MLDCFSYLSTSSRAWLDSTKTLPTKVGGYEDVVASSTMRKCTTRSVSSKHDTQRAPVRLPRDCQRPARCSRMHAPSPARPPAGRGPRRGPARAAAHTSLPRSPPSKTRCRSRSHGAGALRQTPPLRHRPATPPAPPADHRHRATGRDPAAPTRQHGRGGLADRGRAVDHGYNKRLLQRPSAPAS